jgi:hypothetical protein
MAYKPKYGIEPTQKVGKIFFEKLARYKAEKEEKFYQDGFENGKLESEQSLAEVHEYKG